MAVVSTGEIYFLGRRFKKVVRVLKDGKFRIKFPELIRSTSSMSEAIGDTLGKAETIFNETLRLFEESNTTERKVIIYKFQSNISFSVGISLAVAAQVFTEKAITLGDGNTFYKYDKLDPKDDLPFRYHISRSDRLSPFHGEQSDPENTIDWTPERHEFFVKIYKAMEILKNNLESLEESQEKLLLMAESGTLKITG